MLLELVRAQLHDKAIIVFNLKDEYKLHFQKQLEGIGYIGTEALSTTQERTFVLLNGRVSTDEVDAVNKFERHCKQLNIPVLRVFAYELGYGKDPNMISDDISD